MLVEKRPEWLDLFDGARREIYQYGDCLPVMGDE